MDDTTLDSMISIAYDVATARVALMLVRAKWARYGGDVKFENRAYVDSTLAAIYGKSADVVHADIDRWMADEATLRFVEALPPKQRRVKEPRGRR